MTPPETDDGDGAPTARRRRGQRGAGLLSTMAGLVIFLLFLLGAIHLIVHLYATSMVTAAADDAARTVASGAHAGHRDHVVADAERHLRDALGAWGRDLTVSWHIGADEVTVRVQGKAPSLLPPGVTSATGLDIDETVTVRREEFR